MLFVLWALWTPPALAALAACAALAAGILLQAWGADLTHPLYGGGFATLMGPLSSVVGYSPGAVFGMHLLMASLAPPLVWVLARLLMPGERLGPLVAGLGMAHTQP